MSREALLFVVAGMQLASTIVVLVAALAMHRAAKALRDTPTRVTVVPTGNGSLTGIGTAADKFVEAMRKLGEGPQ